MSTIPPRVPLDAKLSVRFEAVLELQERLTQTCPDGDRHALDDLALSLVLSPGREARKASYLVRSADLDARQLHARRRRRVTTDPLTEDTVLGLAAARGQLPAAVVIDHPLDKLFALELEQEIRSAVHQACGARGMRVLDGLLRHETVEEMAVALGAPPRTVERLRASVRKAARTVCGGSA